MLSTTDLAFMRETELLAMSSTGDVFRPVYTLTALGSQEESWSNVGSVQCDIWPISRQGNEASSGNQELAEKHYYISVPYNADVQVSDNMRIDGILYQITFVPKLQSWLTNKRLEARNYNNSMTEQITGFVLLENSEYILTEG